MSGVVNASEVHLSPEAIGKLASALESLKVDDSTLKLADRTRELNDDRVDGDSTPNVVLDREGFKNSSADLVLSAGVVERLAEGIVGHEVSPSGSDATGIASTNGTVGESAGVANAPSGAASATPEVSS